MHKIVPGGSHFDAGYTKGVIHESIFKTFHQNQNTVGSVIAVAAGSKKISYKPNMLKIGSRDQDLLL